MLPNSGDFRDQLIKLFAESTRQGKDSIDVKSGDLHRQLGGYPGRNHRMPNCCFVMKSLLVQGDQILSEPKSGMGATLLIRYRLPR